MKSPVDCEHCGGTGKIEDGVTLSDPSGMPKTYGHHACPVCGGTGKVPGPVIEADERKSNCFVATVAFGDPHCSELRLLRRFRDERLQPTAAGRAAVGWYYRHGPGLARFVAARPRLKACIRRVLAAVCRQLARRSQKSPNRDDIR